MEDGKIKNIVLVFFLFFLSLNFFAQKKDSTSQAIDESIEAAMLTRYIVIAGASSDFNSLDLSAKEISKKSEIPYDNNEMIYDKELGMIVPKDTAKYDMDAGQSIPRRYEENLISIEMMYHYTSNHAFGDMKKMIIITGIFGNKQDAEKQLKLIQKAVPSTYIKKTRLYMGCMH